MKIESDLTSITNIGPATARSLIAAGVEDAAMLRKIGADAAYRALIANGERPHFIGYYVLHMALQGRPWNDCRGAEKAKFRVQFDALVADCRHLSGPEELPRDLAIAFNVIGLTRANTGPK